MVHHVKSIVVAGLSGGYPTHGDTYKNNSDPGNEVRWWGKGGELVGKSPERIAFFRKIMEHAPVSEMVPELIDNGNAGNRNINIYIFSKKGEFYLAYVADKNQTIELTLAGDDNYKLEVIDTWNMKMIEQKSISPGDFQYSNEKTKLELKYKRNNLSLQEGYYTS